MSGARVQVEDGRVRVEGELSLTTVPALATPPWPQAADGPVTVDLAGVRRADSAGLALLLEWARAARRQGRPIHFVHTPEQLKSLARVTGVDAILALE